MTDSPQVGTRLKCPECAGEIIVVKPPRSGFECCKTNLMRDVKELDDASAG